MCLLSNFLKKKIPGSLTHTSVLLVYTVNVNAFYVLSIPPCAFARNEPSQRFNIFNIHQYSSKKQHTGCSGALAGWGSCSLIAPDISNRLQD